VTTATDAPAYYDPYDVELAADPYPMWRRLREEAPLYYNEKYDFYALSRYADVAGGLPDWETYNSGRGAIIELIKANLEIPSGMLIFEDPPIHDVHRKLLSRMFTRVSVDHTRVVETVTSRHQGHNAPITNIDW